MEHLSTPLVYNLVLVSAACSAAGSLFILLTWFLFKELRFLGRKLIVFISLCDLVASATFIFSTVRGGASTHPTTACVVQGYLLEFFALASFLWTACFAYHLYQLICRESEDPGKYTRYYHLVSWGVPALFDAYLLVRQLLGYSGMGDAERPWCWVADDIQPGHVWSAGTVQQFLLFYIPALAIFVWNLSIYVVLARRVSGSDLGSTIQTRLSMYLLVFLLCVVWGLAHRVYQVINPSHKPSIVLSYLEATVGTLQGFLNALVYGVNSQVLRRYAALFRRCCGPCCGCCPDEEREVGVEEDEDEEEEMGVDRSLPDTDTDEDVDGVGRRSSASRDSSDGARVAANTALPPSTRTGPYASPTFQRALREAHTATTRPTALHASDGQRAALGAAMGGQQGGGPTLAGSGGGADADGMSASAVGYVRYTDAARKRGGGGAERRTRGPPSLAAAAGGGGRGGGGGASSGSWPRPAVAPSAYVAVPTTDGAPTDALYDVDGLGTSLHSSESFSINGSGSGKPSPAAVLIN